MITRAWALLVLLVAIVGLIVGGVRAADEKASAKDAKSVLKDVKCPISDKPINPESFVDFEKCKLFFCCDNCPAAFKKDMEAAKKFTAKAHHQMVQTKQLTETACPFTGRPLNPEMVIDVAGVKVAFCCVNCKGKAEKTKGAEQVALVFTDVSKGFKLTKDLKKDEAKK